MGEADKHRISRALCTSHTSDEINQDSDAFLNSTVGAPSRPKRAVLPGRYAEVDTDGDGRISFQEFDFDH
ncbi:hypothetical protein RvY_19286 [Ramazzottius varieornatus]|uniref:EF-hand domain-containing protein n=1 Tax=Ramazzottius varieornatus TaxID=947166 RepID=A0A1D1W8X1_RAMVA|nr:hypothetical protein RvY_19286 [Ramazzottius varieornatus]